MSRARRALGGVRLGLWVAALVVTVRVLVATGRDSLAIPLSSAGDLRAWVEVATPAEMAIGVLRLLSIAACAYLLAVTALGVAAQLAHARGLAVAIDRASPALVRRLVAGGSGAGLVVGTLIASTPVPELSASPSAPTVAAGASSSGPGSPSAAAATMSRVDPATATMTRTGPDAASTASGEATMTRIDAARDPEAARATEAAGATDVAGTSGATATMHRLPDPAAPHVRPPAEPVRDVPDARHPPSSPAVPPIPAAPEAPSAGATPREAGPTLPVAPPLPEPDTTAWVVEPGDSLWSIAAEVVRGSRPDAGDRDISRYWRRLVEANRAELADPGNPDLLLPGQHLTVPAFPA